ncbi:hypothetical protein U879_21335 [Defluviimonas sp. 20V17]|uniref:Uncharacterized protein n=1 Tax=Allgaiera indica TaxID=765699 RepID=A0AAN4UT05_9RHOB|nr:hypothetical protein [Allgaiera indica]KDB01670.1 hypothetical protein U879_21335 [Defluviimonas sp. 20V17]GHE03906.1 hypothetical protein GCM10008024_28970 [Allgaiera indica]SDX35861.1 hypothetical protein SAMN05444006_11484 [Allgaiera indica]
MDIRLTKIAAIALVSLTAAAPMAMAHGVATAADATPMSVSVEALAPQPDLAFQPVSAADTQGTAGEVKVAELGAEPRMPFAQQYNGQSAGSTHVVVTGNLPLNATTTR